jgi:uncharacterized protein (TIGR02996 family)
VREEFLKGIAAIRKRKERYEAMLVFADWLEEQGDKEHEGWRWIVKVGWRPYIDMSIRCEYPFFAKALPCEGLVPLPVFTQLQLSHPGSKLRFRRKIIAERAVAWAVSQCEIPEREYTCFVHAHRY